MNENSVALALVTLGGVFLASLMVDAIGRRTRLPRVTLLLLLGVMVGPNGFGLVPAWGESVFPIVTDMALVMVAFLLGGEMTRSFFREHGRAVLTISILVVVVTAVVVAMGLMLLGWSVSIALLLGAVSTSTDPVAVRDVVKEAGARGPLTQTLLGIVAVDDAWGIMTMTVALALVLGLQSPDLAGIAILEGLSDLAGAVLIGTALGLPIAFLSGRIRPGEPTLAEALGAVFLCGGLAILWQVSFLLSAMVMGVVVANIARHHRRTFRAIEGIEWPFMILFFVLSGASLELTETGETVFLTLAYVGLRIAGRWAGGWFGARLDGATGSARDVGVALLPQAGIAIGMALLVSERVPGVGSEILTATVAGTIVFELIGPILTRTVLARLGETRSA